MDNPDTPGNPEPRLHLSWSCVLQVFKATMLFLEFLRRRGCTSAGTQVWRWLRIHQRPLSPMSAGPKLRVRAVQVRQEVQRMPMQRGAPAQQRSRKQSQNRKPKPKPSSSRPNQSPRCMLAQAVYIPSNPESCMSKATVLANANLLEISGFEHKLRLNGVTLWLQLACTETLHACRVGLVETAHGPGPRPYRQRWLAAWKARRLQFGKLEPRWRLGISL